MKDQIYSLLRHAITALPAVGGYLAAKGLLTPEEAAQLDGGLTQFLLMAAGILSAVLVRLVMALIAKHAPHLRGLLGGSGTAAVAMTAATWGALALAGGVLLTSCVVGVDEAGHYSVRPDPYSIDAVLKYSIRHEDSAKSGGVEWVYYDETTGKLIDPADYAAYGIKP